MAGRSISPINKFQKHEKKTPQGIVKKIMPEKLKNDPFEGMNVAAVSLDPRRPDQEALNSLAIERKDMVLVKM